MPLEIGPGSGVRLFTVRIGFDPAVVGILDARLAPAAGPGSLDVRLDAPGELTLAGALSSPMVSGGALVDIAVEAAADCPSAAALVITTCVLDDGAVACAPRDGRVRVRCGVVGRLRARGGSDPVPGALVTMRNGDQVTMRGAGQQLATATTDAGGEFAFADPPPGELTFEPGKVGDMANAVSALDAALILRASAGLGSLDALQALACDVTGNGSVSTLDASRILQMVVGERTRLPVGAACGSDWAFVPNPPEGGGQTVTMPQPGETICRPGRIALDASSGSPPMLDFTAVLFGDCSGNWLPPSRAAPQPRAGQALVQAGPLRRRPGGRWLMPLTIKGTADFQSLQVRLAYDPALMVPAGALGVGRGGGAMVHHHVATPGEVSVALASAGSLASGRMPVAVVLFDPSAGSGGAAAAAAPPEIHLLDATVDESRARLAPQ